MGIVAFPCGVGAESLGAEEGGLNMSDGRIVFITGGNKGLGFETAV